MLSGKELRLKRIEMDMKAKDLAKLLGVHESYISKMEKGVQKIPSKHYDKWLDILGL